MRKDFNAFRFAGLDHKDLSNKYFTMNRVSEDEKKIVVRVGDDHVLRTKFGWALILDQEHVVFLKDWQVSQNYFGNEVLIQKDFWNVKKWGNHEAFFGVEEKNHDYNFWLKAAVKQDNLVNEDGMKANRVRWAKVSERRF